MNRRLFLVQCHQITYIELQRWDDRSKCAILAAVTQSFFDRIKFIVVDVRPAAYARAYFTDFALICIRVIERNKNNGRLSARIMDNFPQIFRHLNLIGITQKQWHQIAALAGQLQLVVRTGVDVQICLLLFGETAHYRFNGDPVSAVYRLELRANICIKICRKLPARKDKIGVGR